MSFKRGGDQTPDSRPIVVKAALKYLQSLMFYSLSSQTLSSEAEGTGQIAHKGGSVTTAAFGRLPAGRSQAGSQEFPSPAAPALVSDGRWWNGSAPTRAGLGFFTPETHSDDRRLRGPWAFPGTAAAGPLYRRMPSSDPPKTRL